jgi:uncharacterized protein YuzE
MLLEQDTETGATYFVLDVEADVARTVHLDDLVMVDVDHAGRPVGVELAMDCTRESPATVGNAWTQLVNAFPALKDTFADPASLLCARSPAGLR